MGARRGIVIFRYQKNSNGEKIGLLTVPIQIAELLTHGTQFAPVLTEEGILYRFVDGGSLSASELPLWLKELNGGER